MTSPLRSAKPEDQQKVLWLHHEAFGNSPCKRCPGECCERCASARGYFYDGDGTFDRLAAIYGFDHRRGFQTDKGCALPVLDRSQTCLSFACGRPRDRWGPKDNSDFDRDKVNAFRDHIYKLEADHRKARYADRT